MVEKTYLDKLDWQNTSKEDRIKANALVAHIAFSVLDYDYLVKIIAAALEYERTNK